MSRPTTRRLALHSASLFGAISGLTGSVHRRRLRRQDHRLFILEYHDISTNGEEFEGTISQDRFRRHVKWLKQRFVISTLAEATVALGSEARLEHDVLTVTFDDGYEGNHTGAWPVLESEGVPATVFLTTGFLDGEELWFDRAKRYLSAAQDSPESLSEKVRATLVQLYGRWPQARDPESLVQMLKYLTPEKRLAFVEELASLSLDPAPAARPLSWEQVRSMQQGGIEFGGHTVTHPILSLLSRKSQEREILLSQKRIREKTGVSPKTFAYPNGSTKDFTDETVEIARRAGYQAACTTRKGSNRAGCDPMTLLRLGIGSDPTWVLEARVAGLFDESVRRRLWPSRRERIDS